MNANIATTTTPESNPRRRRKRSRRRSRRRNPWDSHDALTTGAGAGIGSLVGAVVGGSIGFAAAARNIVNSGETLTPATASSVMLTPLLSWFGSIAGGAVGGRIGAPDKVERRGTAGGALGGIFGPIGAAVGGAVGGGYRSRRSNPTPLQWAGIAAAAVAAVTGGAWAVKKWRKSARLPPGTPVGGDTTEPV